MPVAPRWRCIPFHARFLALRKKLRHPPVGALRFHHGNAIRPRRCAFLRSRPVSAAQRVCVAAPFLPEGMCAAAAARFHVSLLPARTRRADGFDLRLKAEAEGHAKRIARDVVVGAAVAVDNAEV